MLCIEQIFESGKKEGRALSHAAFCTRCVAAARAAAQTRPALLLPPLPLHKRNSLRVTSDLMKEKMQTQSKLSPPAVYQGFWCVEAQSVHYLK